MLRLLLDEGLSPSISPRLWAEGIDNYPLRDRGLLRLPDHAIWALANEQERAVVTINGMDFRKLAKQGTKRHSGLLIIPSGGTRDDHFRLVMIGVVHASSMAAGAAALRDRIVEVRPEGDISLEITSISGAGE